MCIQWIALLFYLMLLKNPNDKFTVKMFERVYYFSIFSLKAPPIKT